MTKIGEYLGGFLPAWMTAGGWRTVTLALLILVVAVPGCGCLLRALGDRLIYHPHRGSGGRPRGITVEDCTFETADGLALHGWFYDAGADADGKTDEEAGENPVLLWFHGNAGDISRRDGNMEALAGRGVSFFIVDYRGYGRSEGSPSEAGLYRDGEAAMDYLVEGRGIAPERIVCFGRSLGTAVALHTGLNRPCAGLVLESPFTSVRDVAHEIFPVLPGWALVSSRYHNLGKIERLAVPLLIIHGDRDGLVPIEQGRELLRFAPEPKDMYSINEAGHNDTWIVGGEAYFSRLVGFCRRCVAFGR